MNTNQYLTALRALDLTPSSKKTAEALGLGIRQCQRIAAGDARVPEPVAILLRLLVAGRRA